MLVDYLASIRLVLGWYQAIARLYVHGGNAVDNLADNRSFHTESIDSTALATVNSALVSTRLLLMIINRLIN